jgi:signal transduction histidine kinase
VDLVRSDSDENLIQELIAAATAKRWQDRYIALERSADLPVSARRDVARHYTHDANSWVRSFALALVSAEGRPSVRSRRAIVQDFDKVLRGTKLTVTQRANLLQLFEDAQEAGSIGYLALSADRAARLVTAALSSGEGERAGHLRQLDRFLRHIAAYASPTPVGHELRSVAEVLAEAERREPIHVVVERSADVSVNEDALRTALQEILSNAVDAGATEVRVNVLRSNGMVKASVANNGAPMTAEAKKHLFEPWYTTRAGRAGLGLFLARSAVRDVGGDLTARETSDSEFQVELPIPTA